MPVLLHHGERLDFLRGIVSPDGLGCVMGPQRRNLPASCLNQLGRALALLVPFGQWQIRWQRSRRAKPSRRTGH
jgi:hypothetical protein